MRRQAVLDPVDKGVHILVEGVDLFDRIRKRTDHLLIRPECQVELLQTLEEVLSDDLFEKFGFALVDDGFGKVLHKLRHLDFIAKWRRLGDFFLAALAG